MSQNMARFFTFRTFQVCSLHLIAIIFCLITDSLITDAVAIRVNPTVQSPKHNIDLEANAVSANEKKLGPAKSVHLAPLPWMHIKQQPSNNQMTEEQVTSLPIHQIVGKPITGALSPMQKSVANFTGRLRPNQISGTRPAGRVFFKHGHYPQRHGPRTFQHFEKEVGNVNENSNKFQHDPTPNRSPYASFRHRDGRLRLNGPHHYENSRMNQNAIRISAIPPHCQECFLSVSDMSQEDKPVDSYDSTQKFFSEIPRPVALSMIERRSQDKDDIVENTIGNTEEASESAKSLVGVPYPANDVEETDFGNNRYANVFNIKGTANHFYFLMSNGSAATTPLQLQESKEDINSKENPSQKILSCDCKSHKISNSRSSLPDLGPPEAKQQQATVQPKLSGRHSAEKHGTPSSVEDLEHRILPFLKFLQESQGKMKNASIPLTNLMASTRKPPRNTSSISKSDDSSETVEETEEDSSDDDQLINRPQSEERQGKVTVSPDEKQKKAFEDILSIKV